MLNRFIRNMDWNLLVVFVTVVQADSFTLAAKRLHRTQPSISNAIKRLEQQFDHPLIDRKRGGLSLTTLGRRVYQHAIAIHVEMLRIADVATGPAALSGTLRLLTASHMECAAFDRCLEHFHRLHPKVTFYIETHPSERIVEKLESGEARIGLSYMRPTSLGIDVFYAGTNDMFYYCSKRHPLFGRSGLRDGDLKDMGYVAYESDQPGLGLGQLANFRMGRGIGANIVAVSPNDEEVLRLILTGIGFGALSAEHAAPYVKSGDLWLLPPYEGLPSFDTFFLSVPVSSMTPAEAQFTTNFKSGI